MQTELELELLCHERFDPRRSLGAGLLGSRNQLGQQCALPTGKGPDQPELRSFAIRQANARGSLAAEQTPRCMQAQPKMQMGKIMSQSSEAILSFAICDKAGVAGR